MVQNLRTIDIHVRLDIDMEAWEREYGPATLPEIRESLKNSITSATQRPGVIAATPDAIFDDVAVTAESTVRVVEDEQAD